MSCTRTAEAVHEERAREAEERFKRDHTFKPSWYHSHLKDPSKPCLALPQPGQEWREKNAEATLYSPPKVAWFATSHVASSCVLVACSHY